MFFELKKRSNESKASADGMTPLHYAARAGHVDVVEVLLRFDADVKACNGVRCQSHGSDFGR
jgi:ankyrin repeat protein